MSTTDLAVGSPVAGRVVPLAALPDPVFAGGSVGPGVAVDPAITAREDGGPGAAITVVAPVDGTVATLHPHAFVVVTDDGRAVLVHLGLGTVRRRGAGFVPHVVRGEAVRAGQPMLTWEPEALRADGYDLHVPVIALDAVTGALDGLRPDGPAGNGPAGNDPEGLPVRPGDPLFTWRA
ncbi:PTS sugar transporter subunit IIA [Amycolatopsis antarctica]|uniref:PTS sugar transporter subunit IIA n=1 Tax=Amycolatopsis antarctica TaxID=1854586 RepID=UPI001F0B0ACD|nr:PTS glucose transporter subunit IIA [Amycolatopsis antarctica]